MFDEEKFEELSEYVYWLDKNNENYDADLKEGVIFEGENSTYKVIKVENNITNGMQAMAVALVKNNIVDSSEIIIAYAGTNSGDNLDFQTVIGGSKELDTSKLFETAKSIDGQVITAERFTEDVKNDYPDAVMTTTGHSLGEYIALSVAAEKCWI